jgi:hypothetical protein
MNPWSAPARGTGLRRLKLMIVLILALGGTLAGPSPSALGDADPASDVLLAQSAFYPYQPSVPAKLSAVLERLLRSASHDGLSLKVAIIGSPEDLGAVPDFFGHPQQYARFLDREISFNHVQSLLVVMPAGFATIAAGAPTALSGLRVDAQHSSYGLTSSAIRAVVTLVRATGHTVAMPGIPPESSPGGAGNLKTVLLFAVPAVLLILAGIATLRSSAATKEQQPPGSAPA